MAKGDVRTRGMFYEWVEVGDDDAYPRLHPQTSEQDHLEWVLRYGADEQVIAARLQAASIVAAYEALLAATNARRNQVAAALRRTRKRKPDHA